MSKKTLKKTKIIIYSAGISENIFRDFYHFVLSFNK